MVTIGISQIMGSFVELFGILYTSAYFIYSFFITPLSETVGAQDGVDEILGDVLQYTPIELMFGTGLILVLILGLVKFFTPI